MQQVNQSSFFRDPRKIFFISLLLLGFFIVFTQPRLFIPLGIAYILTLMIRPLKPIFVRASSVKKIILICILIGLGTIMTYLIADVIDSLNKESENIQSYVPKIETYATAKIKIIQERIFVLTGFKIDSREVVAKSIGQLNSGLKELLLSIPNYVASFLEWSFIIPLFLFFFLKDGRKFKRNFFKIVPNDFFEKTYYLFHQFNKKFGDYIFAKFMEATIITTTITIGLVIIGFPFALLLGLLAGATNIVPYLGPFLGFAPALVIGLVGQSSTQMMGAMIMLYLIANIVDLALVFPVLVSKIVNLHPIVVVISVIIGSQVGGVMGMVVSIPMAALVKLIFEEIINELYPSNL